MKSNHSVFSFHLSFFCNRLAMKIFIYMFFFFSFQQYKKFMLRELKFQKFVRTQKTMTKLVRKTIDGEWKRKKCRGKSLNKKKALMFIGNPKTASNCPIKKYRRTKVSFMKQHMNNRMFLIVFPQIEWSKLEWSTRKMVPPTR